mmetsp:Transcript_33046/g.77280  ORF Transcript_33046/g.77280 Transcript_33046/m.77280 type:complete len:256 (-) Transcript_33046:139-906(-)
MVHVPSVAARMRSRGDLPSLPVPEDKAPKKESALVAWRARRKQTLHGNLGTGNKISSVIQYPICGRDPLNFCRQEAGVLSAEERRVLRVVAKHSVRAFRGTERFAEAVYDVEDRLIDGFRESEDMRQLFFKNETYANRVTTDVATMVSARVRADGTAKDLPAPNSVKKLAEIEDEGSCIPKQRLIPHQHDVFCGPVCICPKSAASALAVETGRLHELPVPHHKRVAAVTDGVVERARQAALRQSASTPALQLDTA